MGLRGPKPKNAALKLLAGNPGNRAIQAGPGGGRVERGRPQCPPELDGEAGEEWARISDALEAAGTLCLVDRGVLAAYCVAVSDLLAARAEIAKTGRWLRVPQATSSGDVIGEKIIEHPAVKLIADASRRIDKLGAALGITPAARARQEPAPPPVAANNKVTELRDRIAHARTGD